MTDARDGEGAPDAPDGRPSGIDLVVVLDGLTCFAWPPRDGLDDVMDAFERRAGLTPSDRTSLEGQMSLRLWVHDLLRGPGADARFTDVGAAACLWLALRHYSAGHDLRRGLDEQVVAGDAVLTISIGHTPGTLPGTAWSFMVGDRIHDGRPRLAETPPCTVTILERDAEGGLRTRATP